MHKLYVTALAMHEGGDPTWYVNTKTTQHMCYDKEPIINYQSWKNWQVVFLGDDTTHCIMVHCQIVFLGDDKTHCIMVHCQVVAKILDRNFREIHSDLHVPNF